MEETPVAEEMPVVEESLVLPLPPLLAHFIRHFDPSLTPKAAKLEMAGLHHFFLETIKYFETIKGTNFPQWFYEITYMIEWIKQLFDVVSEHYKKMNTMSAKYLLPSLALWSHEFCLSKLSMLSQLAIENQFEKEFSCYLRRFYDIDKMLAECKVPVEESTLIELELKGLLLYGIFLVFFKDTDRIKKQVAREELKRIYKLILDKQLDFNEAHKKLFEKIKKMKVLWESSLYESPVEKVEASAKKLLIEIDTETHATTKRIKYTLREIQIILNRSKGRLGVLDTELCLAGVRLSFEDHQLSEMLRFYRGLEGVKTSNELQQALLKFCQLFSGSRPQTDNGRELLRQAYTEICETFSKPHINRPDYTFRIRICGFYMLNVFLSYDHYFNYLSTVREDFKRLKRNPAIDKELSEFLASFMTGVQGIKSEDLRSMKILFEGLQKETANNLTAQIKQYIKVINIILNQRDRVERAKKTEDDATEAAERKKMQAYVKRSEEKAVKINPIFEKPQKSPKKQKQQSQPQKPSREESKAKILYRKARDEFSSGFYLSCDKTLLSLASAEDVNRALTEKRYDLHSSVCFSLFLRHKSFDKADLGIIFANRAIGYLTELLQICRKRAISQWFKSKLTEIKKAVTELELHIQAALQPLQESEAAGRDAGWWYEIRKAKNTGVSEKTKQSWKLKEMLTNVQKIGASLKQFSPEPVGANRNLLLAAQGARHKGAKQDNQPGNVQPGQKDGNDSQRAVQKVVGGKIK